MSREARIMAVWHLMLAIGAVLILASAIVFAGGSTPGGVTIVDDRTWAERWNERVDVLEPRTAP